MIDQASGGWEYRGARRKKGRSHGRKWSRWPPNRTPINWKWPGSLSRSTASTATTLFGAQPACSPLSAEVCIVPWCDIPMITVQEPWFINMIDWDSLVFYHWRSYPDCNFVCHKKCKFFVENSASLECPRTGSTVPSAGPAEVWCG